MFTYSAKSFERDTLTDVLVGEDIDLNRHPLHFHQFGSRFSIDGYGTYEYASCMRNSDGDVIYWTYKIVEGHGPKLVMIFSEQTAKGVA